MQSKVTCVHIGARSHYLLPKALEHSGNLNLLITDTWVSSSLIRNILSKLPIRLAKSFAKRYSSSISSKYVKSFTFAFLFAEIFTRYKYKTAWQQILTRNDIFQQYATSIFKKYSTSDCVFGISYTSLQVFREAKKRGQKTILFQIDAGLKDEKVVLATVGANKQTYPSLWQSAPDLYWLNWKEECILSDVIMVNSEWSRNGLVEEGVDANKIKIIPLPFELTEKHFQFAKSYPPCFTKERPLCCLFLGNISLRKGVHLILEAAQSLIEHPIKFIFVGESEIDFSTLSIPNIYYYGVAARSETYLYYQDADVFLFPTFSDGFGLTQLEAMAWQLPVIASCQCGDVVKEDYSGLRMQKLTVTDLKEALLKCMNSSFLQVLSSHCLDTVNQYNLQKFSNDIRSLL